MRSSSVLGVALHRFLLLHASLFSYRNSAAAASFPNRSSVPDPQSSGDPLVPPSTCGLLSCSISLDPVTLSYPTLFTLVETTVTATLIPVVVVHPDGSKETITSTFAAYNTNGSNQTFINPSTSDLTWEAYDTTLTYPTTYVAYPSPTLVLQSPVPTHNGPKLSSCSLSTIQILMPSTATSELVFPRSDDIEYPGSDLAYSYLDQLPTVSALVSGAPSDCFHGINDFETPSATGIILPLEPITHTSVSVLTQVGRTVTLAAPPADVESESPPTSAGGGLIPQTQQLGSTTGGEPAVTNIVVGGNTIGQQTSGVVVNGQTITQGPATTLSNGLVVSVGSSATVVVVSGSTISLSQSPAPSSTQRSGAGRSSNIGIVRLDGTSPFGSWVLAMEFVVVIGFHGVLALL